MEENNVPNENGKEEWDELLKKAKDGKKIFLDPDGVGKENPAAPPPAIHEERPAKPRKPPPEVPEYPDDSPSPKPSK